MTADMQTHKNPAIRSGPAPFKAPPASITNQTPKPFKAASPPEKPAKFTRDGKKWLIVSRNDENEFSRVNLCENCLKRDLGFVFVLGISKGQPPISR